MWAWAASEVDCPENVYYGNSLDTFMQWLCALPDRSCMWFHNLKFDGEFIYNWLFDHGWEWVSDVSEAPIRTFTTLISDKGMHYCIQLNVSSYATVEIRDSLKVIPMPVAEIPKAFGLPDSKLELDYKGPRERGHELTPEEKAYITEDVVIVAKALRIMLGAGMDRLTAGSNALKAYKDTIGGSKGFRKRYPVPDYDAEVRAAYKGGFTYVNPRFQGYDVGEGISFDVNSLYPFVMRTRPLPYGDPKRFKGEYVHDELYPLYVQAVSIDARLKPDHIPCMQVKETAYSDRFSPTEYITDTHGPIDRTLTNVDLELIYEQYDVLSIEFHEGWKFKASTELFAEFIDSTMADKVKATHEGNKGMRQIAKLKMNSSYGKMGTNPHVRSMRPVKRDGRIYYERLPEEEREPVYIPSAVFITAWARRYTVENAQALYDRFIYADTDSLYLRGTEVPDTLRIDDAELGAWKHEHTFTRFKALRAKSYVFVEDGKLNVHCAGLPARCFDFAERHPEDAAGAPEGALTEVTFDNFEVGAKYYGKLFNVHTEGGIVLEDRCFTIK